MTEPTHEAIAGESFTYTFSVPGTYTYFCIPHVLSGMVGTVIVGA